MNTPQEFPSSNFHLLSLPSLPGTVTMSIQLNGNGSNEDKVNKT